MSARLMDGKAASEELVAALQVRVAALPFTPRLTFVRVGDDPASAYYVRSKERVARRVGVESETRVLPDGTTQDELLALVDELNRDPEVDGVLVQLPAPGVDELAVLEAIDPAKDVDGLHPLNVGRLWTGRPGPRPATPLGVAALADRYGVPLAGARAVVVGRSSLVGKPLAAMLLERDATVTLAHSRTLDLAALCREADVLVVAVGRPALVTREMVKPGAAVFDVGLSRVDGKVVGDVSPDVAEVAGWLTPMPGGTGLMTVAMVVANTVDAAVSRRGQGA
ncbi:MAG TPA: bifunctional 5,10-methylenetetrahydrofolate dehydrogenase/5,10-methenyltetrahydrofolate cyclohydrolase [Trueperaceae bacterium]|nr:bifunctional 5,10-methylenetetrahydrofolate dehydrogenase/5,10-methenyltetrahydrofolate cyclohydrolase [Trueperaceae bacterium]